MYIERRLHLFIGLTLGVGLIIFAYLSYISEKKEAEASLLASAEHVRGVLMATRRVYHHQFVESGLALNEKTIGFLPAHALNRISKDLENWDSTGFSFNNVSDQPRNSSQKADQVEMLAVEYFRNNPSAEVRFVPFTTPNGDIYYHYSRPIWVEQYCLQCHGERSKAPEAIQKLYDNAYNYKVGDLRGILSIKVPARSMHEQLVNGIIYNLIWACSTLALLWIVISLVVRNNITHPLGVLKRGINSLSVGTFKGGVGELTGEFGDIGQAFDRMAESLEQERLSLASSEQRFRYLATTATDAIILADERGVILFWNEGAERIFGYGKSDVIGKPITTLIPDRFIAAHQVAMGRVQNGGEGKSFGHSLEVLGLNRHGEEIPLEVSLNSWVADGARYFVAIMRDIRARKVVEADLLLAKSQAEASSRAKSAFLAVMSHEIRTPLTGVIGMADILSDTFLDEDQRLYIDTMRSSAKTLLTILNDIIDYSRIESNRLNVNSIVFDAVKVIAETVNLSIPSAVENMNSLTFDAGGFESLIVKGDDIRIKQVIGNLISNAVKFTRGGSILVRLRYLDNSNGYILIIEVEDSGIGISDGDMSRLFEPFTQLDPVMTRRFGGTGLGLSISKRLAELMGGDISVTSKVAQGTCFRFACPVERGNGGTSTLAPPQISTIRPMAILLAEDNSINRMIVKIGLQQRGHHVTTVENGLQACEAAAQQRFDLILMDIQMPLMDGIEATRRIRLLPHPFSKAPIAALTADALPEHRAAYMEAGLTDFLTKPIDWSEVSAVLSRIQQESLEGGSSTPASNVLEGPPG